VLVELSKLGKRDSEFLHWISVVRCFSRETVFISSTSQPRRGFGSGFHPDATGLAKFVDRLRPLAAQSSYVAAALPQILLQAGMLDEVVELALSGKSLPVENPLCSSVTWNYSGLHLL
jgi:hypothetical protein